MTLNIPDHGGVWILRCWSFERTRKRKKWKMKQMNLREKIRTNVSDNDDHSSHPGGHE